MEATSQLYISPELIKKIASDDRIDFSAAPAFERLLTAAREIVGREGVVIADLSDVSFLGSVGGRAMINERIELKRKKGDLEIVASPESRVGEYLALAGIDDMFPRHDPATFQRPESSWTPDDATLKAIRQTD